MFLFGLIGIGIVVFIIGLNVGVWLAKRYG